MAKDTCEAARSLSIFWLRKYQYLHGGYKYGGIKWTSGFGDESSIAFEVDSGDSLYIKFSYSVTDHDGTKERFDYKVQLTTTPCKFGGKRFWFVCPLVVEGTPCRRRVGMLYLEGKYFGCRRCYSLAYRSQQESSRFRAVGKFLSLSEEIEKKEQEMRVRFWKGRPTKRFSRLVKKMEGMGSLSRAAISDLEMRDKKGGVH